MKKQHRHYFKWEPCDVWEGFPSKICKCGTRQTYQSVLPKYKQTT